MQQQFSLCTTVAIFGEFSSKLFFLQHIFITYNFFQLLYFWGVVFLNHFRYFDLYCMKDV